MFLLSFPTRERGLKLQMQRMEEAFGASFPTRERGLKLYIEAAIGTGY